MEIKKTQSFQAKEWSVQYQNDLPDLCFAFIAPGGKEDEDGKTVPRTLRNLPCKDVNGKIDLDCMNTIAAAAGSAGTATGKSLSATGTEFTMSNSLGTKDILSAKALTESFNAIPDSIIMNPLNVRDLYYLPRFSLYGEYGEAIVKGGFIGTVYNMRVFSTTVRSAGSAYILSTGQNVSAAYAPLGFFVVKRPLMSDLILQKELDSVDVSLSTRYSPVITCGEFMVKKVGLATS